VSGPSAVPAGTTSPGGTGPDTVLVLNRDATLNTYQPHLATLQDPAQNLAEKDWQSQYAQQRFHDRVVIILGWALMALAAFLAILAMDVLFDGAILYGTVMLLAAVVVAIKGALMALYTDWPS
jgi:hypothetical protein